MVLAVNVVAISVNIICDYALIFGHWGLPELGIVGAAWATNIGLVVSALCFAVLFLGPRYRSEYATLRGWKPDLKLLLRLLRFGGPNGVNFMLDIMAFTFFLFIVGRLGPIPLAATNLAFHINSLAFMPLIGCSIAVSTMVGQRLGRDQPEAAEYCTWSGLHLAMLYMGTMSLGYVLVPEFFLAPFGEEQDANFAVAHQIAVVLLRFVALYCVFDAAYMVFAAALKGAGDTRFVMWISILLAWAIMVVPSFAALTYFDGGLYLIWSFGCAYICVLGVALYLRFRTGRWQSMRVIERADERE